jgi:thymidine kinase
MNEASRPERGAGHIEVITGGMFSGKSEELVRRLRRAAIARQRIQVFKPASDDRHGPAAGRAIARLGPARDGRAARQLCRSRGGRRRAQFSTRPGRADPARRRRHPGRRRRLDQDYSRHPFGPMPKLLAIAELVDKMHAVCVRCGAPAHYSQRISGGADQVQVGDTDAYEARCDATGLLGLSRRRATLRLAASVLSQSRRELTKAASA